MDKSVTKSFGHWSSLAAKGGFELGINSVAQFVVTYNLMAFWLARRCASAGVLSESANNNHIEGHRRRR